MRMEALTEHSNLYTSRTLSPYKCKLEILNYIFTRMCVLLLNFKVYFFKILTSGTFFRIPLLLVHIVFAVDTQFR